MKIKKIVDAPNLFIIDYEQCNSEEESYNSVKKYFGFKQQILDEIQTNLLFWINLIRLMKADNHDDIVLNRDILPHILKSRDFSDQLSSLISIIYGISVEDADYQHITKYIEEICKTNGLIYRLECNGNEIRIFHTLDNPNFTQSINDTIIKTLEVAHQNFALKKKGKITILNRKSHN